MTENTKSLEIVAIDGPSASGKSTVARKVAARLKYLYVDSGSLYRAVTWKAMESGISTSDAVSVTALLPKMDIEFVEHCGAVEFRLDGRRLDGELRTAAVNENVSPVAACPAVRECVTGWLRSMVRHGSLVVEGRDIGTVVFPRADYKFYLDASAEERAKRRFSEIQEGTEKASVEVVGASLKRRDAMDSARPVAPLKTAPDAVIIDSTGMTIDEVVESILELARL